MHIPLIAPTCMHSPVELSLNRFPLSATSLGATHKLFIFDVKAYHIIMADSSMIQGYTLISNDSVDDEVLLFIEKLGY